MHHHHPDPAVAAALEALRAAASALERAGPPPPAPPADGLPRWLRAREVAALLGLSPKHVYALMARGVLPTVRINRAVRVPEDGLRAYMARAAAGGTPDPARPPTGGAARWPTPIVRGGRHGAAPR